MTLNLLLDGLTSSSTLPYLGMFVLDVQSFSLVGVFGSRSNMIVLICFFFFGVDIASRYCGWTPT